MTRIKIHPIGYKKVQTPHAKDHTGETLDYVQTIKMANGQIRTIKHYKIFAIGGALV